MVYLKTSEVAELLGLSESVLVQWRQKGSGPPWVRLGRKAIRYPKDDLERWGNEQRTRTVAEERADA